MNDNDTPQTDRAEMCPMSIPRHTLAVDSAFARAMEREVNRLRTALTTIRTSGNDSQQCIWMQKVAASALEPGRWPDAGKSPLANAKVVARGSED
jgi:hypothetical protein